MAERQRRGERHPTIPHLYRTPQPRTASSDVYPYLHSQGAVTKLRAATQAALGKGLLADATRGATSPLGGLATPAQPRGKGKR